MGALLALIPTKDLVYGGIIAAILAIGTAAWIHHDHVQQAKGAAAVTAADAKTAAAVTAKNAAVAANAQHALDEIGLTYHAKITLPAVANTGLVCRNAPAPNSRTVSGSPQSRPGANGPDVLPEARGFDPSGAILTLLRDADTRVAALQDTVRLLVDEMNRLHDETASAR